MRCPLGWAKGTYWVPMIADVDGDGKDDLVVWNPDTGEWQVALSQWNEFVPTTNVSGQSQWLLGWSQGPDWHVFVADVDGDGKDDLVAWNTATGEWQVALSQGNALVPTASADGTMQWLSPWAKGSNWQILIADVDGDGKDDLVAWNPTTGGWQVALSQGNAFVPTLDVAGKSQWLIGWAKGAYWRALVADVDGDGKDDLVVWNPGKGEWQVALSQGNAFAATPDAVGKAQWLLNWARGNYWRAFVADVDGDGKDDLVAWSPGNPADASNPSNWQVALSSGTAFDPQEIWMQGWATGDYWVPLVGDFDGDGKDDLVVWDPAEGDWQVARSVGQGFSPSLGLTCWTDVGPSDPMGKRKGEGCAAGVIEALAGDEHRLFAVSKTSGIWVSVDGGSWTACEGSPRYARALAVDPASSNLLAVGTRAGDAIDPRLDECGLWESRDSGTSWSYTYNPYPDTGAQQLYDVAYAPQTHTLFLATAIGVGRRPASDADVPPAVTYPSTALVGKVRALAISETKIWARTDTALLFSDDDGVTWTVVPLPKVVPVASVPGMPSVPGVGRALTLYDNPPNGNSNDRATLAAFDDVAYLVMKLTDDVGNPVQDPVTHTTWCPLLIFNPATEHFIAELTNDGDGRGLGGRRRVRAFVLPHAGPASSLGAERQLFYVSGQGLQVATSENADHTVNFSPAALTTGGGTGDPTRPIHSDIWDVHASAESVAPDPVSLWIAGDGGVYKLLVPPPYDTAIALPTLGPMWQNNWASMNTALYTHNIHRLTVSPDLNVGQASRLLYGTQDNDAWWRTGDEQWFHATALGDADNWVLGDAGTTEHAVATRAGDQKTFGIVTAFDNNQQPPTPTFSWNSKSWQDAVWFECIQTLPNEPQAFPALDVVMLAHLPVHDDTGAPLSADLFTPGDFSHTYLLVRNEQFINEQDGPQNHYAHWTAIATTPLPGTPQRVWVAGGHQAPVYYLAASDALGRWTLYKYVSPTWQPLMSNLLQPFNTPYGPAFIDPFDPTHLFVIARTFQYPSGVILESRDGGTSFQPDAGLSALVTNSGQYLLGEFDPVSTFVEVGSAYHGQPLFNPSQIVFCRDNPAWTAAASPVTGVFFRTMQQAVGGSARAQSWRSLARALPAPYSYVSALGTDGTQVFVATEGRGLIGISGPAFAPPATYFDLVTATPGTLAVLRDATTAPVPGASIAVRATRVTATGGTPPPVEQWTNAASVSVVTDPAGTVVLPVPLDPGQYLIELTYASDGALAAAQTRFRYTI